MCVVTNTVLLRNALTPKFALQVDALADTGSLHLCIPQRICDRLQLQKVDEREVLLADGSTKLVPYVGPVEIRFKSRAAYVGAIVIGDRVLVGAIPMQEMGLIVIAGSGKLEIGPTARGVSEPPGRYVLPTASRGPGSSFSAGSP